MIEIKLTKGKIAIVDDEDYELVSQYKWYPKKHRNTYYAMANGKYIKGERQNPIFMHQLVFPSTDGHIIDHINRNGLDNRQENLRFCTNKENTRNRVGQINASSCYKGVDWKKSNKKWRARIRVNDKEFHLGCFVKEEDAAQAYDEAAIKYFGEFAYLNFGENYGA